MPILVTGFGPFGSFADNPSSRLAETCGADYAILEVSYHFVRSWLDSLDPASFDALLMIGLYSAARTFRLEKYGHNRIGRVPDVDDVVPMRRRIEQGGPWRVPATIWTSELGRRRFCRQQPEFAHNGSAGSYLCNFALYSALRRFPNKRVGFLHVPPFERIEETRQRELLDIVLTRIEADRVR